MAGSGRRDDSFPTERVIDRIHRAQERSSSAEVEAEVSGYIDTLLSKFNDRDHEAVRRHLDGIKGALEKDIGGFIGLVFGGSVAKHTYVDGLSDVDSLVILDSCELAERPPGEARAYLARRLKERYPSTPIREGSIAVTLHFEDVDIQLVPVVSCRSKIKISGPEGDHWALIDPKAFSEILFKSNNASGGKLIPVIKVAKSIVAKLPRQQRLESFHLEALAIEAFRDYNGPRSTKAMLKHFFQEASRTVIQPVVDPTEQSSYVDSYLGSEASLERRVVSDALARIARRMGNADVAQSVDQWKDILD